MKRVWMAAALCCVGFFAVRAAGPAETRQERGKRVVYEALQAMGGDAFLHTDDRVETGRAYSFYRRTTSGTSIASPGSAHPWIRARASASDHIALWFPPRAPQGA